MKNDKTTYERELILRLINSDEKAFNELYVLYRKWVFSTVYGFIRNKEFAEDIYQDTFTTIWNNRRSLNPNTSFASFVYTIARNKVYDYLRSISKHEQLPECFLSQIVDEQADILERLKACELEELLNIELQKLSRHQRRIFKLSREENLTYGEIADHLGISVVRVKYILSGTLKSLRYSLGRYGILTILGLFI